MSEETKVATETKPEAEAEKPLNMDKFKQSTKHCTRRVWNIFLGMNDDIEQFKTRLVRGKLTATSDDAAQKYHKILVEEGGVQEITTTGNELEFTATLAAVQLVIREPETLLFDATPLD